MTALAYQLKVRSVDKEAALSAPLLDMLGMPDMSLDDIVAYTQEEARQRAFAWSLCGVVGRSSSDGHSRRVGYGEI